MKLKHGIPTALKQFDLIAGAGSEDSKQACAMTLLAWCAGREWSDAPPCAHPVIRTAVIRVNDASGTTPEMREAIVRAGKDGILDTWWIPVQVVALAFALESKDEKITEHERLLRALDRIAKWKLDKGLPPYLTDANLADANLTGANLTGAYLARAYLARAYLADANLTDANLTDANLTGAYLTRANLARANLADANLAGANLTGAYLARAYLAGANLAGAYLTDANLTDAYGTPTGGLPDGWKLSPLGLWARS